MEPNRSEKKQKKAAVNCQCMVAELVKLHYYEDALANTELDRDTMRDKWEAEKIQGISRQATSEQIRQGLLTQVAVGWNVETEIRQELDQVTREWRNTSEVVGRLQRRVNNLVDMCDMKARKVIVAEHKLLNKELEATRMRESLEDNCETIQNMKKRFEDMRTQRDLIKNERDAMVFHYERVITEMGKKIDANDTESETEDNNL